MIKLMIVDDQVILRESLKFIFNQDPAFEVVACAATGDEAIDFSALYRPEVVLMDINMPVMNGVEATKRIKVAQPEVKVIVLTTFLDEAYIVDALRFGASGYLLKDTQPEDIKKAIVTVCEGGTLIDPEAATKLVQRFQETYEDHQKERPESLKDLTEREIDILRHIAEGLSNQEIGDQLFLTEGTVKNHITKILSKLDLRDRTQLAIMALKAKL